MALRRKKSTQAGDVGGSAGGNEDAAPTQRRSKAGIAVPVACLAVGALLGPKFLGGEEAAQAGATDAAVEEESPVSLGAVVVLDPVRVNLADGRVLEVGVALQLAYGAQQPSPEDDDPTRGRARELDAVLDTFGRSTMAELVSPTGRDEVRARLVERLSELTDGDVVDVYFHRFVMA